MTDSPESRAPALSEQEKADALLQGKWIAGAFDTFIDSIEIGVYLLDCRGIVKRVNRFILEHYDDWSEDELLEKNVFELMPDLGEAGIEKKFRQVIDERRINSLTNFKRKDKSDREIVYNIKGIPIMQDDHVIGVLVVMTDITEKLVLESQVAEAQKYLQSLIDNANDIIHTLDQNGNITFLNKMGQEITGYEFNPSEEAHYTNYIAPEDVPENILHFQEALKGRAQRFAASIVASDGRLVDMLVNLTPIYKGPDVVGVLGISRDITERKRLQAQLMQAGKMAAIGELAAGVAHEINNPIGIISGAAEQLQFLLDHDFEKVENSSDRFLSHVGLIREQAYRCSRITQGLLNFARKTEVRTASVDIAMLIREAVTLLESRAATERKKIETDIAENLPLVTADPHLLEQVFVNIANNALDAVGKGGTVTIRSFVEGDKIAIEIADDGEGIIKENMERIFDPFFTTKPPGKGTGLGLSICFGIVEQMGGTISVESTPRVGTSFVVLIPFEAKRNDPK